MVGTRNPDASQRQELVWLLDEAESAIQAWWLSEHEQWPEILSKLVSKLQLCEFDLEADIIASEVQATPKLGRKGCRNRRELLQLRQRVVDRVRKRIIAIRKVIAGGPPNDQKPTKSIGAEEAEFIARRLHKKDVTFRHLKAEDMAKLIAQQSTKRCSESLVKGLPYWKYAMELTGRGRKKGGATGRGRTRGTASRPVSFSKDLEAVTGDGEEHGVLEDLARDEEKTAAERAMREQIQAIELVKRSRLKSEEQRQTIAKLEAGEMTPQQAGHLVSMCEQDSTRNRKKARSHD